MTTPRNTVEIDGVRHYKSDTGKLYPSVTALIRSTVADQPGLAAWKQRELGRHTLDIAAEFPSFDSEAIIAEACERANGTSPKAELGTAVHKALEDYENDSVHPDDLKVANYLVSWIDLKAEHGLEILATELTLVNTTLGYAGTADAIAGYNVTSKTRGRYLLDYKTGSGVYDSYALQLSLLAHCDAWMDTNGTVVPFDTLEKPNAHTALIAKIGPQSAHLHKVDGRTAWYTAKLLPTIYEWQIGGGRRTISASLPGKSRLEHRDVRNDRRMQLLERARQLDARIAHQVKAAWAPQWPSLTEPTLDWTLDNLDDVEQLIANAERGGLA